MRRNAQPNTTKVPEKVRALFDFAHFSNDAIHFLHGQNTPHSQRKHTASAYSLPPSASMNCPVCLLVLGADTQTAQRACFQCQMQCHATCMDEVDQDWMCCKNCVDFVSDVYIVKEKIRANSVHIAETQAKIVLLHKFILHSNPLQFLFACLEDLDARGDGHLAYRWCEEQKHETRFVQRTEKSALVEMNRIYKDSKRYLAALTQILLEYQEFGDSCLARHKVRAFLPNQSFAVAIDMLAQDSLHHRSTAGFFEWHKGKVQIKGLPGR